MSTTIWKIAPQYPPLLKEIHGPPACLFCLGQALNPADKYFAIVGTRRTTPYGRQMAEKFAHEIANAGFVVVSGLAYGIDAIAHEATLEAGGRTIAVLGAGFDYITPPINKPLALKIQKSGTVISEYPPDFSPRKGTFPQRNRIIAGMSLATLVIEAPQRSGALITARLALEYNRDVFALPGNITQETSRGTNMLIRDCKAFPVTDIKDIFEYIKVGGAPYSSPKNTDEKLNTDEKIVYDLLKNGSAGIDQITAETKLPPARVNEILSTLEIKGLITVMAGYAFITR